MFSNLDRGCSLRLSSQRYEQSKPLNNIFKGFADNVGEKSENFTVLMEKLYLHIPYLTSCNICKSLGLFKYTISLAYKHMYRYPLRGYIVYVYIICLGYIWISLTLLHIYSIYTYVYTYVYICTYVYTYVYTYGYTYVYIGMCVSGYRYMCIRVYYFLLLF